MCCIHLFLRKPLVADKQGNRLQKITVNTGRDRFILLDKIVQAEPHLIQGMKTFNREPAYLGIETLAQLGAFHVRYITDFQRHAFVLKINQCRMPSQTDLIGTYHLSGVLVSRSEFAFSYELQARSKGQIQIEGVFLFATVDYDRHFRQENLQRHYRDVFTCLQSVTKEE